jgi:hypothetical protein
MLSLFYDLGHSVDKLTQLIFFILISPFQQLNHFLFINFIFQ